MLARFTRYVVGVVVVVVVLVVVVVVTVRANRVHGCLGGVPPILVHRPRGDDGSVDSSGPAFSNQRRKRLWR